VVSLVLVELVLEDESEAATSLVSVALAVALVLAEVAVEVALAETLVLEAESSAVLTVK